MPSPCSPCSSFQYCSCLRVQLKQMDMISLKVQSRKSHFLCTNLVIVEVNLRVVQVCKMWKKKKWISLWSSTVGLGGILVSLLLLFHHPFIPESVPWVWIWLFPVLLLSGFIVLAKFRRQQLMYYTGQAQKLRTTGRGFILHGLLL